MDICNFGDYNNGLVDSSIFNNVKNKTKKQDDFITVDSYPYVAKKKDEFIISPNISRAAATNMSKNIGEDKRCATVQRYDISETSTEPYCHVKLDSIIKLKDSTKKLLCLLEEIKSKSRPVHPICAFPKKSASELNVQCVTSTTVINSVTDVSATALKRLEIQTNILDAIPLMNEDDDCSIFKKLTRKCNCLNQQEYNDFIIHFNEASNYYTSTTGEVIKNLRILKRFLYMGGDYAKHALMFLNQGLEESSYAEKVEIIQGCAYADMCNVFENVSIVITCIAWPYKYDSYGDTVTQELAAEFVYKLAQLEEGRRYLKFTCKVTNDINKVLKKKGAKLQIKTLELLCSTLDQLHSKLEMAANVTDSFYNRHVDEGFGNQTMQALIYYRHYMTLGEILTHLDLLNKWSMDEKGKTELKKCQKLLLELFKDMLLQYNDSELNVIVADILNNLISKSMLEKKKSNLLKIMSAADASTEPIQMQDKYCQNSKKKIKKCITTRVRRQNVAELRLCRRANNFKDKHHVIIVPLEK